MLSLKKLLGKDDKFFELLEAGAEEVKASADLFSRTLQKIAAGGAAPVTLDEFIQTRRKEKRLRDTMKEELSKTFVTPLEREDIEALSFALYRIPKQVEKIARRFSGRPICSSRPPMPSCSWSSNCAPAPTSRRFARPTTGSNSRRAKPTR
jgi:hypothetical protein